MEEVAEQKAPPLWKEIVKKDDYKILSTEEKRAARDDYFTLFIEPKVHPKDISYAKQQFDDAHPVPIPASEVRQQVRSGVAELGRSLEEGMARQSIGGLSGLAVTPFAGAETGAKVSEAVQKGTYTPQTKMGQKMGAKVGETIAPVGNAYEKGTDAVADYMYEKFDNSPIMGALGKVLPDALLEMIGFGTGRRAAKQAKNFNSLPKVPAGVKTRVSRGQFDRTFLASAPEVEQIRDAATGLYKELDSLNVSARPTVLARIYTDIQKTSMNVDEVLHPQSFRIGQILNKELKTVAEPRSLTQLENIRRKILDGMGNAKDPDKRILNQMLDDFDDVMDHLEPKHFMGFDKAKATNVGQKYQAARSLWARAKRSETITELFEKADRSTQGFGQGVQSQIRALLNNKKRSRFFSADEKQVMHEFSKGTNADNALKLIGTFGIHHPGTMKALTSLVGIQTFGAAILPAGVVSQRLFNSRTTLHANKILAKVRGGGRAEEVVETYMKVTPKNKWDAIELSDILTMTDQGVSELLSSKKKIIRDAAARAEGIRLMHDAEILGTATATGFIQSTEDDQ